jgi:hypothetical protein
MSTPKVSFSVTHSRDNSGSVPKTTSSKQPSPSITAGTSKRSSTSSNVAPQVHLILPDQAQDNILTPQQRKERKTKERKARAALLEDVVKWAPVDNGRHGADNLRQAGFPPPGKGNRRSTNLSGVDSFIAKVRNALQLPDGTSDFRTLLEYINLIPYMRTDEEAEKDVQLNALKFAPCLVQAIENAPAFFKIAVADRELARDALTSAITKMTERIAMDPQREHTRDLGVEWRTARSRTLKPLNRMIWGETDRGPGKAKDVRVRHVLAAPAILPALAVAHGVAGARALLAMRKPNKNVNEALKLLDDRFEKRPDGLGVGKDLAPRLYGIMYPQPQAGGKHLAKFTGLVLKKQTKAERTADRKQVAAVQFGPPTAAKAPDGN